ncbi:MAG TPA: hypothetical protein VFO97_04035 [Desertimonas sp.]|nr:hypothetical protein [Desertimonas sp.]
MTEFARCRWCRRALPERGGRGRPRQFCSQRCRQWDWVSRQRARELELSDGELVIARAALDELHDQLYVLACAVHDTDDDLAASTGPPAARELRRMLDWLLEAARPLAAHEIPAPPTPPPITS